MQWTLGIYQQDKVPYLGHSHSGGEGQIINQRMDKIIGDDKCCAKNFSRMISTVRAR